MGEAAPIATHGDLRALNKPEANDAYAAMFKRARALLPVVAGETRGDRNGRTMLLLGVLTYARTWIHDWRPQDFGRVAVRVTAVLLEGFATGSGGMGAAEIDLTDVIGPDEAGPREQFLRAGTRLINNEGYHGASVERISATLNLTKGALYHHNATKDDLVEACYERTFAMLWRLIETAEGQGGSGASTLTALVTAAIRLQLSGGAAPQNHSVDRGSARGGRAVGEPVASGVPSTGVAALRRRRRRVAAASRRGRGGPGADRGDQFGVRAALLPAARRAGRCCAHVCSRGDWRTRPVRLTGFD